MIKNKIQYNEALNQLRFIEESIDDLEKVLSKETYNPQLKLQKNVFIKQRNKLHKAINKYEDLINGKGPLIFNSFYDDMNEAIISYRIASKITLKEVAERMYIQQQQIQRYEQKDYLNVDFERILQLLDVLNVQLILKKERGNTLLKRTSDMDRINEIVKYNKYILEIEETNE